MSGYILCQVKKAEMPYYIENISTNIYTIEELCYYLYHNIYLLDETIIGEALCDWLRDELGLEKLYYRLYRILEEEKGVGEFILPIFKEINYLSHAAFQELNRELALLSSQSPAIRQKKKGDYLINNQMYVNAIKVYEKSMKMVEGTNLGGQFVGEIYHNMGCAYMHLFQIPQACGCFWRAYECLRTKASIQTYLIAYRMDHTPQEWEKECAKLGVDAGTKKEIAAQLSVPAEELEPGSEKASQMLEELTREYHRSTGF
ncbi:MAG: hypothetical protein ACOYBL_05660 [Lachnospiraceae bacterium]|jgi:hypothetical protein